MSFVLRHSILKVFFIITLLCSGHFLVVAQANQNAITTITPTLINPKLKYVDTSNGLSQDVIQDLHIDAQGFVWIATQLGLNRFDGANVITVNAQDDALEGVSVHEIFEHSSGLLFLGTDTKGLLIFDRITRKATPLIAAPMTRSTKWLQSTEAIVELDSGVLLIAMTEGVYQYDVQSNTLQQVFTVTDPDAPYINNIRSLWANENLILIGTTQSLIVVEPDSRDIKYLLSETNGYSDTINIKLLKSDDEDTLFAGAVKGLYRYSLSDIEAFIQGGAKPEPKVISPDRNIRAFTLANQELAYVGTEIGVFTLDLNSYEFSLLFYPVKDQQRLSRMAIRAIEVDSQQNLWFATYLDGAGYWSANALAFDNVYQSPNFDKAYQLSDNLVSASFQYDANTLFIGTKNGLNRIDLQTGQISTFLNDNPLSLEYTDAEILRIQSFEEGYLWLTTALGVRYFSIAEERLVDYPFVTEQANLILSDWAFSIEKDKYERLWVASYRGISVIEPGSEAVTLVPFNVDGINFENFIRLLGQDVTSNSILVSTSPDLWGIDIDTLAPKLLHSASSNAQVDNRNTEPQHFARDVNNDIWVTYPSVGVFVLDGRDFTTKRVYTEENGLSTTFVYDLAIDDEGDAWVSSQKGIQFIPRDSGVIRIYGKLQGLESVKFSPGSGSILQDGKVLFGSSRGFTTFEPMQIKQSEPENDYRPIISSITLSSRSLSLPLQALNDTELNLKHDDAGIVINYSTLQYDSVANSQFQYRTIFEDKTSVLPTLGQSKMFIPVLSPGKHIIEIFRPGDSTNVARLTINMAHPPFQSPFAYSIYALTCSLIFVLVSLRRRYIRQTLTKANAQVRQYNQRLKQALVASNTNIWEWHASDNTLVCDRWHKDLHAPKGGKQTLDDYIAFLHKDDVPLFTSAWDRLLSQSIQQLDVSYRVTNNAGKTFYYRDVGSLYIDDNGQKQIKGTYANITESRARQEKLKLFGDAFKNTRDWVLIFDKHAELITTNLAFKQVLGIRNDESDPQGVFAREHPLLFAQTKARLKKLKAGEHYKTEKTLRISGKTRTLLADLSAVADEHKPDDVDYYLIIGTDITEQVNAQNKLHTLTNYDVLTGLMNRNLLIEHTTQSIVYAKRNNKRLAILFIDLDGFKPINDSFGHDKGDLVLTEIANRLRIILGQDKGIARVGGDEFVAVLNDLNDIADVSHHLPPLLSTIERSIKLDEQTVSLSASIGVSVYPDDATNAELLIANADIAMFNAKTNNTSSFSYFTPGMNDSVQQQTILQNRVKVAVNKKEFVNYYQPIIDPKSGKPVGAELLLRWFDNGAFVPPDKFIPVLEQIGNIIDVTMHAILRAVDDLQDWYEAGFDGYIAVNLSAKHFATQPDFKTIVEWLHARKLPKSSLRFEITEGLFIDSSSDTVRYLREMQDLGFKIALDDFGTGYSSLRYLKEFPLDVLKIDKSFVQDLDNEGTESIVKSTMMLSQLLGLDIVAEGVETKLQLDYFLAYDNTYVQGYYFAKAMPVGEVKPYLMKTKFLKGKIEV